MLDEKRSGGLTADELAGGGNDLLAVMTADDRALIAPACVREQCSRGAILVEADARADAVYFVEQGIASVVKPGLGAYKAEIALIGPEGFIGAPVVLGDGQSPYRTFAQVEHLAVIRLASDAALAAMARSPTLHGLLARSAYTQMVQAMEGLFSASWQHLDARLARWLLMYRDRMRSDRLDVTHQFMAMMLGTRRPGVTEALHDLEGAGLITASRGLVIVRDLDGLRTLAGRGYGVPEEEHARLFGTSSAIAQTHEKAGTITG